MIQLSRKQGAQVIWTADRAKNANLVQTLSSLASRSCPQTLAFGKMKPKVAP